MNAVLDRFKASCYIL